MVLKLKSKLLMEGGRRDVDLYGDVGLVVRGSLRDLPCVFCLLENNWETKAATRKRLLFEDKLNIPSGGSCV